MIVFAARMYFDLLHKISCCYCKQQSNELIIHFRTPQRNVLPPVFVKSRLLEKRRTLITFLSLTFNRHINIKYSELAVPPDATDSMCPERPLTRVRIQAETMHYDSQSPIEFTITCRYSVLGVFIGHI